MTPVKCRAKGQQTRYHSEMQLRINYRYSPIYSALTFLLCILATLGIEGCSTLSINQMIEPGPVSFSSNSVGEQSAKWVNVRDPRNGWHLLECKNIKIFLVPDSVYERLISVGPPFIPLVPVFWTTYSFGRNDTTLVLVQFFSPKNFDLPMDTVDAHSTLDGHKFTIRKSKFKDNRRGFVISYSFEESIRNIDGAIVNIDMKKLGCLDLKYKYIMKRHYQYMPVMEND